MRSNPHSQPPRERLGIYGGTFDPIHLGHLVVATEVMYRLSLDRVLFVPAGRPPHKVSSDVSSVTDRLAMVELALRENASFSICPYEIDRAGLSYTVETLEHLRTTNPESDLFFIIGEDSLHDLPTWREPDRILELAHIVVAMRPGPVADLESPEHPLHALKSRISRVRVPLIEIASREIRRRVATGEPIRYQVPSAVEQYIETHGLYQPKVGHHATAESVAQSS